MRIRVEGPVPRDVVVDTEVSATVGDLTAALVPGGGPTGARIDGAWFPPTAPLASTGIGHGSGVGVDTATEGGGAARGVAHRPAARVRREGLTAPLHRARRDLPPPPPPPITLPALAAVDPLGPAAWYDVFAPAEAPAEKPPQAPTIGMSAEPAMRR